MGRCGVDRWWTGRHWMMVRNGGLPACLPYERWITVLDVHFMDLGEVAWCSVLERGRREGSTRDR